MIDVAELSQRLRNEVLKNYASPLPDPNDTEELRTLYFFMETYAIRDDMSEVKVSVRFMQTLCLLGAEGYVGSSSHISEKSQKDWQASLLNKLWILFSWTLVRWVEKQRQTHPTTRELWYSCFQVPVWFIEAVEQHTKERQAFVQS